MRETTREPRSFAGMDMGRLAQTMRQVMGGSDSANAYRYGLVENNDFSADRKWSRIEAKRLPMRIGNFELRRGWETQELQEVLKDMAAIVDRLCPWTEFVAAPEIVGIQNGREVSVRGAAVATNVGRAIPGVSYKGRVVSILFSTQTEMDSYLEAIYGACFDAVLQEARISYGQSAVSMIEELDKSLMAEADPDLQRTATSFTALRRKAFEMWAMRKHLFGEGNDFLAGSDDMPAYERLFYEIETGQMGAKLAFAHNPTITKYPQGEAA